MVASAAFLNTRICSSLWYSAIMALPIPPRLKPRPIIHINGFPGTGKLTIARELVTILQEHFSTSGSEEQVKLVHNHLLINPADAVLHRTQAGYQTLRKALRDAVFSTLKNEPATFTTAYLFTDWQSGDDIGKEVCKDFQLAARERGSDFIPIVITCEEPENIVRLRNSDRGFWNKITDVELLVQFRKQSHPPPVYRFEGVATRFELDVTNLSAQQSAECIMRHLLTYL
jgi:tRNA uridine 5-carbamoylmethylation protein Kti12